MAINVHLANKLCNILGNWWQGKSVLTLGVLDPYLEYDQVLEIIANNNLNVPKPEATNHLSKIKKWSDIGYVSSDFFFTSIGISKVTTIDYSAYEGADILFDLNESDIPAGTEDAFDLIIDAGTLEHIFHVPNALANLSKMIKPGGRIVHFVPCSNFVDHGFYQFSPTLFKDYYRKNKFDFIEACIHKTSSTGAAQPNEFIPYIPDLFAETADNGLPGEHNYFNFFVVEKNHNSTIGQIPQQSGYEDFAWKPPNWEEIKGDSLNRIVRIGLEINHPIINDFLSKDPMHKIAVYGAGSHTTALLEEWSQFIDAPVTNIIETHKSIDVFKGIEVMSIHEFESMADSTLVIPSTLGYQDEMIAELKAHSSRAKYLSLYDTRLRSV